MPLISPIWGHPWPCCTGHGTQPRALGSAQLSPPVASHFPSCLSALLVLLADRWGSRWSAKVRFQTLLWCTSSQSGYTCPACSLLGSAFSVTIRIKGPWRVRREHFTSRPASYLSAFEKAQGRKHVKTSRPKFTFQKKLLAWATSLA